VILNKHITVREQLIWQDFYYIDDRVSVFPSGNSGLTSASTTCKRVLSLVCVVAVGILLAGVLASMNFGAMSTEAQTTIHGNQTVNGTTMAGNTTIGLPKSFQ
jgi:hypothetical protein